MGEREPEDRIERVLEESLKQIESPEAAHAVVTRLEQLSSGRTEAEAGDRATDELAAAPDQAEAAARAVEACANAADGVQGAANAIETVAAQSVAPTPAAETAMAGAQAALTPAKPVEPTTGRRPAPAAGSAPPADGTRQRA